MIEIFLIALAIIHCITLIVVIAYYTEDNIDSSVPLVSLETTRFISGLTILFNIVVLGILYTVSFSGWFFVVIGHTAILISLIFFFRSVRHDIKIKLNWNFISILLWTFDHYGKAPCHLVCYEEQTKFADKTWILAIKDRKTDCDTVLLKSTDFKSIQHRAALEFKGANNFKFEENKNFLFRPESSERD